MLKHDDLASLYTLAQDFCEIVRNQQAENFDRWLVQADNSHFFPFRHFARGLRQDYAEVKAALSVRWSNDQLERQVNRLKLIKREMYGRAKVNLLRQRVLHQI